MVRLTHFGMALRSAEYVAPASDATRVCGRCDHMTAQPQSLRCDQPQAGFFVRPNGTCKHFTPKPIEKAEVEAACQLGGKSLTPIGPTDI